MKKNIKDTLKMTAILSAVAMIGLIIYYVLVAMQIIPGAIICG